MNHRTEALEKKDTRQLRQHKPQASHELHVNSGQNPVNKANKNCTVTIILVQVMMKL